jgi:hypothetical protein
VTPHTCARPSAVRSSKYSANLCDHQVHGHLNLQLARELFEPVARRFDVRLAGGCTLDDQILCVDREDHAVQRPARPMLVQEREALAPPDAVGRRVGVLCRISSSSIEEDRFVGEPPVAVARAADAAQRAFADTLLERKLQAGIEQRRGLARAWRADDHVPRQVVEAVSAAPLLLQRLHRFVEPVPQLLDVGWRPRLVRCLRLRDDGGHQSIARAEGAQPLHQLRDQPAADDDADGDEPRRHGFEGPVRAKREIRAREPDEQDDQQEPEEDDEGALEECEHGSRRSDHMPRR